MEWSAGFVDLDQSRPQSRGVSLRMISPTLRFGMVTETGAERFEVLARRYRDEAAICWQHAKRPVRPLREAWLRAAARWIKLAQEARGAR
jgi:hypothetical protein